MSAIPMHTPVQTYTNQCGEPVTLTEMRRILEDLEDIAMGMKIFCEARIKERTTWEESSTLMFMNLGLKQILAGLCDTVPEMPKGQEVEHE